MAVVATDVFGKRNRHEWVICILSEITLPGKAACVTSNAQLIRSLPAVPSLPRAAAVLYMCELARFQTQHTLTVEFAEQMVSEPAEQRHSRRPRVSQASAWTRRDKSWELKQGQHGK